MKYITKLKTSDNVILYYSIQDTYQVVIGNKTTYNGKNEWLIRGDSTDMAREYSLFDKTPVGWSSLEETV